MILNQVLFDMSYTSHIFSAVYFGGIQQINKTRIGNTFTYYLNLYIGCSFQDLGFMLSLFFYKSHVYLECQITTEVFFSKS